MKIQLIESGGIAGKYDEYPILVVEDMDYDILNKLDRLMNDVDFFNLPSKITSGGHDFIYTTIIIEDNGVSNSVKTDFNGNSQTLMKLRKLVNYIQDLYNMVDKQQSITSTISNNRISFDDTIVSAKVGDIRT